MQDRILIVDDDDLVLACFERLLSRQFNIETAMGPLEALDALATRGPYAVLLSDLRMPGIDGIELVQRAKELSPNIVGIVLSGNVEPKDLESGTGIYRFLDKPCPTALLANTLTEAINHHHKLCRTK